MMMDSSDDKDKPMSRARRVRACLCSKVACSFLLRTCGIILLVGLVWTWYAQHAYSNVKYTWFDVTPPDEIQQDHYQLMEQNVLAVRELFRAPGESATNGTSSHPHSSPESRSARDSKLSSISRELCLVITTIPRLQPYFMQTFSSLLQSLSSTTDLQKEVNIYILNGAIPSSQHQDVIWLERQLQRLRQESDTSRHWPHLHIIHLDERRQRRKAALNQYLASTPSAAFSSARDSAFFRKSEQVQWINWHDKELMDYLEGLNVCYQHWTLSQQQGMEFDRSLMNTIQGDWIYELLVDSDNATQSSYIPAYDSLLVQQFRSDTSDSDSSNHRPPPYALILEDDLLITHDFLAKLYSGLKPLWDPRGLTETLDDTWKPPTIFERVTRPFSSSSHPHVSNSYDYSSRPYAFVRLFLTNWWGGWEEMDYYWILIPFSVVAGLFGAFISLVMDWCYRGGCQRRRCLQKEEPRKDSIDASVLPLNEFNSGVEEGESGHENEPFIVNIQNIQVAPTDKASHRSSLTSTSPSNRSWTTMLLPSCLHHIPFLPPVTSRLELLLPLFLLAVVIGALSLLVCLAIGKQNFYWFGWLNATHYEYGLHPSGDLAGTQAVIYPQLVLPTLMNYIIQQFEIITWELTIPIDIMLNNWLHAVPYVQYHLTPDLVQHAGGYSSNTWKNQGTYYYWKTSSSFRP